MTYYEFLEKIINEGIQAAKAGYILPDQKQELEGSIIGFQRCRDKLPQELLYELRKAREKTEKAHHEQSDRYWFIRCQEAEIEWVCNCISAMLVNEGREPIVPVTAMGMLIAAKIAGVVSNDSIDRDV